MKSPNYAFAFIVLSASLAPAALAALEPGQTLTLTQDLVVTESESLNIAGTADKPCTIVGNHHQIRSADKWTGSLKISHCRFVQLGTDSLKPEFHAMEIRVEGESSITIEDCIFDQSSGVSVYNTGNSTTAFRRNTVLENSAVPVRKDLGNSRECFLARGDSHAPKFFQGNHIYKGHTQFDSGNWMIGGDRDADSNIYVGHRIKIVAHGHTSVIRGNYLHVLMPRNEEFPYWSQVSTVDPGGNLLEQNLIRDGEWIVQFTEGEVRFNVICDINDHNLMRNGSVGRVHHNIFNVGKPDHPPGSMSACIYIVYAPKESQDGMEIFNNVFDGCDTFASPGVEVCEKGRVKSVRNNVFYHLALPEKYFKLPSAVVRPSWSESELTATDRLGYADYNLMFNPAAKSKLHYTLTVAGKTQSKETGFGLHDCDLDPRFTGPLPREFPFNDEEIKSGKMTVSKMLAFYRGVYTPAPGSPLIGAGDPADGAGKDIGAVDSGKTSPHEGFGRWGMLAQHP